MKKFTCDDGSGTFEMTLHVQLKAVSGGTFENNFRWLISSGTGRYEDLEGFGTGVGITRDGDAHRHLHRESRKQQGRLTFDDPTAGPGAAERNRSSLNRLDRHRRGEVNETVDGVFRRVRGRPVVSRASDTRPRKAVATRGGLRGRRLIRMVAHRCL